MSSITPLPRTAARDVLVALTALVIASTTVVAAAWTERAEARDRGAREKRTHYSFGSISDSKDEFSYALLDPGDNASISTGEWGDWRKMSRLADSIDRETLWFSIAGVDYVVDDPSAVAEAAEILAPLQGLGERQGRLGSLQGELGAQQGRLGAKQGALGARQGVLGARLALVALDRDAEGERGRIEQEMAELERRQEELSREQEPLARRQEELGRKQEALGKQQEEVGAKARVALRELAGECVGSGTARKM